MAISPHLKCQLSGRPLTLFWRLKTRPWICLLGRKVRVHMTWPDGLHTRGMGTLMGFSTGHIHVIYDIDGEPYMGSWTIDHVTGVECVEGNNAV